MKKPIIAGKISKDPSLLAKIKRQTGTNSCNFDTPDDPLTKSKMLKIPAHVV